jgi:hypothetical protein
MLSRTRSRTQTVLRVHPNEEVAHTLHSIQPLLEQHKLQSHDHGQHPDCQFTSFIHVSKKTIPDMEEIMSFRKACKNWLIGHPTPLVESRPDWRNQIMLFGYRDPKFRKQGNEHSLCGLAGAFSTRINAIVFTTSGHHIQEYNPPENIQHTHIEGPKGTKKKIQIFFTAHVLVQWIHCTSARAVQVHLCTASLLEMLTFNSTIQNLWGRVLKKFQEVPVVVYNDNEYIKTKMSVVLQVLTELKCVLKKDTGLEINVVYLLNWCVADPMSTLFWHVL